MAWRSFLGRPDRIASCSTATGRVACRSSWIHARLNLAGRQAADESRRQPHGVTAKSAPAARGFCRKSAASRREGNTSAIVVPATPKPKQRPHFPASRFSMLGGTVR